MRQKTTFHKTGFPPLVQPDSKVLILGSMPGEKSLAEQQYYAHPRNFFWPFIAAVSNETLPKTYEEKKALLIRNKIALWDVCDACIRSGSLDTAIVDEIPNKLEQFLDRNSGIHTIAFNGKKAAALFHKYFTPRERYTYINLPSTSPANAGMGIEEKHALWMELHRYLS